jgi:hypothetical protein
MITEMTLKLATIPERCCVITAHGSLKGCTENAGRIIQSNMWPAYIVAIPLYPPDTYEPDVLWEISIGFEGIGKSVESQMERAESLLREKSMQSVSMQDCHPVKGRFSQQYNTLDQFDYLLRTDVPLDRSPLTVSA